jgi:hypothetical protein
MIAASSPRKFAFEDPGPPSSADRESDTSINNRYDLKTFDTLGICVLFDQPIIFLDIVELY